LSGHIHSIFVSIAAYRDSQLGPTIRDCLGKASRPERVRLGICWQRDVGEPELPFQHDPRVRLLALPWQDSKGACWARAEIMKLWQGEDWFLQIDSHSRFANNWDDSLLRQADQTRSAKPIISTYPPPFTPGGDEVLAGGPLQMIFQQFTPEGIPQLRPGSFLRGTNLERPLRARFLAAGFLFAPGTFVKEVPYDPNLYFMGEEASMTVRAFTHGYDLFHPSEVIVWHDYLRLASPKHWDDHGESARISTTWNTLDETSRRRVGELLMGGPVPDFGLGRIRALKDYEDYAGLSFRHRKAQAYTLRGAEPPNPAAEAGWTDRIYPWIATVRFAREQIPAGAFPDATLWSLSILDSEGCEVCHRDVSRGELNALAGGPSELAIICEFASETIPESWSLWPLSQSGQWLPKFGGKFGQGDFAVVLNEDE
jgi:Glycosyltransferase (GlcNAc)